VAAADKLDNARSLLEGYRLCGDALWQSFRGGRDGMLWYLRSVVEVLQTSGGSPLVDELARAVSELTRTVAGGSGA
jgi:GTP pyrophosphokinase